MNTIARALALSCGMSLAVAVSAPAIADDSSVAAAKKDLAATLGPGAIEANVLPESVFASAWAQYRAIYIDQKSSIPPKYRALIGLAVSSQIPCQYCIYADTSDARTFGATDEEIKDAIMQAGITREWSAIMNGNMVDMNAFKKEIDAGAAAMRESMKN